MNHETEDFEKNRNYPSSGVLGHLTLDWCYFHMIVLLDKIQVKKLSGLLFHTLNKFFLGNVKRVIIKTNNNPLHLFIFVCLFYFFKNFFKFFNPLHLFKCFPSLYTNFSNIISARKFSDFFLLLVTKKYDLVVSFITAN